MQLTASLDNDSIDDKDKEIVKYQRYLTEDVIPKKKVKDKIKKLRRLQFKSTDLVAPWEANQGTINSLQELLEE